MKVLPASRMKGGTLVRVFKRKQVYFRHFFKNTLHLCNKNLFINICKLFVNKRTGIIGIIRSEKNIFVAYYKNLTCVITDLFDFMDNNN